MRRRDHPAVMAKLVVQSGAKTGREFTLVEGLNRMGRDAGNEVCLEDPGVSAVHCELWLMQERLLVRDLNSTNGTLLDGRLVAEGEVSEGSVIAIGGVELLVREAPSRVAIPKAPPPPPPPPRFTAEGVALCLQHPETAASHRCSKCGEQFCGECVRLLGRRGGRVHAYCPLCGGECVSILPPRVARVSGKAGWVAKLTQTLRLRR